MFAMFVWFCMRFIWPPIINMMAARQKRIDDGLLAAERGFAAHKDATKQAEQMLSKTKIQAAQIISNADKQANMVIENAKDVANQEAQRIKEQAQDDIAGQELKVRKDLQKQVAGLVLAGVNSVLEKEVDSKEHADMLTKLSKTL